MGIGLTSSSVVRGDGAAVSIPSSTRPRYSAVNTRNMRFHRRIAGIDKTLASSCGFSSARTGGGGRDRATVKTDC